MPGKTNRAAAAQGKDDGFNEAPAKCRGKPIADDINNALSGSFNEAPAKCRGKQADTSTA